MGVTTTDSQEIVSNLLQIGQVGHQQGLPQPGEIAMLRVLDLDDAPRVSTTADGFAVDREFLLRADDGEREQGLPRRGEISPGPGRARKDETFTHSQLRVVLDGILVVLFHVVREIVDGNAIVLNVLHDLR